MAIKKETETKSKVKKTVKSATLKTMKDAEEKAVNAVAKVKKAAATKVSKISEQVKKVAAKKTATKTAAEKTAEKPAAKAATKTAAKTATKTAVKTTATKTVAKKPAAKTATKAKASEKEVAKLAQSFDAEYLVLMQKDPNWMHAFWEVSENRINEAKHGKGKIVLRLFDIENDNILVVTVFSNYYASSVSWKFPAQFCKISSGHPAWISEVILTLKTNKSFQI